MVEYARKGLIGVLTPQANTTVEPEFAILMPPGYAFLNARMVSDKPTMQGRLDDSAESMAIPGAVRINPSRLERYKDFEILPTQEVVLYCACPGEFTSARVALALQRKGVQHVRPLAGGLQAWRAWLNGETRGPSLEPELLFRMD